MNFTVTNFKKKKSIKWQILKCHDFSDCSAQKPIWKYQNPSPHQSCKPGWLPRLWRIPGRIPVCFGFLREAPSCTSCFLHGDISLASISEWHLGVCPKYQEGKGVFWQFCSRLDHSPRSPMHYLPQDRASPSQSWTNRQHRVPWDQPAQMGSGG